MNEIDNSKQIVSPSVSQSLIEDLRQIIEQARGQVAATANYAQTMMYWHVGERINREVLGNQRAEYGKQIVSAVSTQLQAEYGISHGARHRVIKGRRDLTLDYWRKNVDSLLTFQEKDILQGAGSITNYEAEETAKQVYDVFNSKRKQNENTRIIKSEWNRGLVCSILCTSDCV